jgi:5-methylcytosine-specific restriction endonuclease McrA
LSLFPEAASQIRQERTTIVDENTARLAVNLSNETLADLQKIKDLLSHSMPEAGLADVIAHLAKSYLDRKGRRGGESRERKDDEGKGRRRNDNASFSRCGVQLHCDGDKRGSVTPRLRRQILSRDKACTYKDPKTGKICGSTYQLEVDHIYPKALGGSDRASNLRALCRKHNLLMAEKILGLWVRRYQPLRGANVTVSANPNARPRSGPPMRDRG